MFLLKEVTEMSVFTVSAGGAPVGNYTATFAGIESQPANPAKGYGPGLRFKFAIDAGPQAGQTTSRITSTTPTQRNACGRMLSGLLGRPLRDGEQIDVAPLVGKRFMVVVAAGREGGTRVEAVTPIPAS